MRRLAAFALMLALTVSGSAFADVAVNGAGMAALVASDGSEIISIGDYVRIEPLKPGFWRAITGDGRSTLLNGEGQPVTGMLFEDIRCLDGALLFCRDGGWGLLSDDGGVLVEPRYADIRPNGEGDFIALRNLVGTGTAQNVDYVDSEGRESAIGLRVLYGLNDYSEGFMPILLARTGRFAYMDTQGVVAFGGDYTAAAPFQNGYAVVGTDNGMGVINRMGRMTVPDEFSDILRMGGLALLTKEDGSLLAVKLNGEIVLEMSGVLSVGEVGGMGLIRTADGISVVGQNGETVFSLGADAVVSAGLNGQLITAEGSWGESCVQLRSADGTALGEPRQLILPLDAGAEGARYAVGRFEAGPGEAGDDARFVRWDPDSVRFALADERGELLTEFVYTFLREAEDGLIYAGTEEGCGLITPDGEFVWQAPGDFRP